MLGRHRLLRPISCHILWAVRDGIGGLMALSPQDILKKEFSVTLRRGYEKDEVDEFLLEVAKQLEAAQRSSQAATDPFAALGDQVGDVLRAANETAAKLRSQTEAEAATIRKRAADKALEIRREAQREAEEALAKARSEADTAVGQARADAARMREEAERVASELRADAERERQRIIGDAVQLHERLIAHEQDLRDRVSRIDEAMATIKDALAAPVEKIASASDDSEPAPAPPQDELHQASA